MESLYSNIGEKIKGWASFLFLLATVLFVLAGLILLFNGGGLFALLIMVLGPLCAWISSWLLYGFGELIDKTSKNERHSKEMLELMRRQIAPAAAPAHTGPIHQTPPVYTAPVRQSAPVAPAAPAAPAAPVAPQHTPTENNTIICCSCGIEQPASRTVCWNCGAKFK